MKTIEEKAKAYDELTAKLKEWHNGLQDGSPAKETLEYLLPQFRASEDERIRRSLVRFLTGMKDISESGRTSCAVRKEDAEMFTVFLKYLEKQKEPADKGEISDGYHTFNELYYYRMLYNAAFFNLLPKHLVHKSRRHHDGEECFGGGWFIVMAQLPTGQISNHYELKDWDLFQVPEQEKADEWDGHTPKEAAERIFRYLQLKQKPAEWSEEEHCKLDTIEKVVRLAMEEELGGYTKEQYKDMAFFLHTKVRPQKWQTWSEEDQLNLNWVIAILNGEPCDLDIQLESLITWLKSLRPQPHWKPSEEQMAVLSNAERLVRANNYIENARILAEVIEELKKL